MAKTSNVGWNHPIDESDQWDGFNDSGIETFAGSPIKNLARELIQNALDAKATGCVQVVVRLHRVKTATIPGYSELAANIQSCRDSAAGEGAKAQVFFDRARELIAGTKVNVLEVSDFNTHGMRGPATNGSPYFAFMKAKGQSRKDSDTAAGSYGIGKFAPYAVSMIRTIFVSTVFSEGKGHFLQYTQGKAILMSHDDGSGRRRQGTGYWGIKEKCQPAIGIPSGVPEWVLRAKSDGELSIRGTKLSILCFDDSDNWRDELAVAVAENFFGAIATSELSVDVDEVHVLNSETIGDFLSQPEHRVFVQDQPGEPDQFENAANYLTALCSGDEVFTEESQMRGLGNVQAKILVREGLPKKVCFLRNGMFITDSLDRLKTFSDFKDFVVVVRCMNDAGNSVLRDMEPPRHNDFEPERRATRKDQKLGKRALKDLAHWIREMLKRHAKDPVSDVTPIDELKEFFYEEGADGSGDGTEDINPYGDLLIQARPIRMRLNPAPASTGGEVDEPESGYGGTSGDGSGNGSGHGDRRNRNDGGKRPNHGGGQSKPAAALENVRTILRDDNHRRIAFTPRVSSKIQLKVYEAGADSDYETSIRNTDIGEIRNGCVVVDVTAGSRCVLNVELNRVFGGAIKVVAHEL